MATYYVGTAALKSALNITGTANDDYVLQAVDSASRMVEEYKRLTSGRTVRYYPSVETRYYTPSCDAVSLDIDDAVALNSVAVDRAGTHSYAETWTAGTQYVVEPVNNPLESKPIRTIVRNPLAGQYFPGYPQSVKVTGTFGWATTPALVTQAATLLAQRYYSRRNSPTGVFAVAEAAVRLPRTDPDVVQLLDAVDSNVPRLVA